MTLAPIGRSLPTILLAMCAVLLGTFFAAPASADEPVRMPAQVVDAANVLTPAQEADVTTAVERLTEKKGLVLSVIYVHDFGGLTPDDWASKTMALNPMGYRDLLLAVSTNDRSFSFGSAEPMEDVTDEDLAEIADSVIAPAVSSSNWKGAAIGSADELAGIHSSFWTWFWVALAAVLVAILGLLAWLYRRNSHRLNVAAEAAESEVLTVDQLADQPVETLETWSAETITATDNAVSVSADELALAVAEYGEEATAPFRAALTTAESAIATSFQRRRELDEQPNLDDDARRAHLIEIIAMCSDADGALDQRATEFDALRNLGTDATERLDALADRSATLTQRIDAATEADAAVSDRSTSPIAGSVTDNVALAEELVQFADDSIEQGREGLADNDRRPTIAAIRSAESALDTAGKLLDSLADADLNVALLASHSDDASVATALVSAAESYVDTRRGVVGSQARTSLSEAVRLLSGSDDDVQRAASLATEALELGRADVAAAGSVDAPVLTGVLIDSVVSPGSAPSAADLASGFNSGGRCPGSFGGSDTAGRIGTGGRH